MAVKSISTFLLIFATITSCTKDESKCNKNCKWEGQYKGTFHDVAACFGCIPFRDTTFTGSFLIKSLEQDSILIIRSFDQYEWRLPFSENGIFSLNAGPSWGESFTFIREDSLKYYSNRSGSGGYFRTTFEGAK